MSATTTNTSADDSVTLNASSSGSQSEKPSSSTTEVDSQRESELRKCIEDADEIKKEGTEYFKAGDWEQALNSYRSAVGRLPKRDDEEQTGPPLSDDVKQKPNTRSSEDGQKVEERPPLTGVDLEVAKARSVLNANIGACHVKLGDHKEAAQACSDALADDPHYVKALLRRASCNEQIDSWSSLASAEEDYNTLLKVLPPDSPQRPSIYRSLASVKPRVEAAQKKETGEMFGKLKDLGNQFLGNFGLSTDNFKFEPNGQGGYSVNFGR